VTEQRVGFLFVKEFIKARHLTRNKILEKQLSLLPNNLTFFSEFLQVLCYFSGTFSTIISLSNIHKHLVFCMFSS